MDQKFKDYCTGCGLCQSIKHYQLEADARGFYAPQDGDNEWFSQICPASGRQMEYLNENEIWGRYESVYLGYSNDEMVRRKASSGGVLTEVAVFLLESGLVDEIIHIGVDPQNQTKTKIFYSKTAAEVLEHCGSRYTISSPLMEVGQIDRSKKYAFIGKPCDVTALRNYLEAEPELKKNFVYLLSFFCMGLPSQQAQEKLLRALNCTKDTCSSLTYRGNGWPGYATAIDLDGNVHRMDYASSWGNFLGRDVMTACKFCLDGIGEMSDISCGDAWHLKQNLTPDFSEHAGRNVIFARTAKGEELLHMIRESGKIALEEYGKFKEELPLIQESQYRRRQDMQMRVLAMRVMNKPVPNYPNKKLKSYSKNVSLKKKMRTFLGTCKRAIKGKMQ